MNSFPRTHIIGARVPDAFALDVDACADALGISRSQLVYQACHVYIDAMARASKNASDDFGVISERSRTRHDKREKWEKPGATFQSVAPGAGPVSQSNTPRDGCLYLPPLDDGNVLHIHTHTL